MTKRARYDGPHTEVAVFDSEAGIYADPIDIVVRGGLLSADVPARIRDELLQSPDWAEVKQSDQSSTKSDKE
jgi:hypothetical protein